MRNEYIATEFSISDEAIEETGKKYYFIANSKQEAVKSAAYYLSLAAPVEIGKTGLVLYSKGKGYTITLNRENI